MIAMPIASKMAGRTVPMAINASMAALEFVADVNGGSEGRAAKPRRALRCLRVSVPRAPVLRVRF